MAPFGGSFLSFFKRTLNDHHHSIVSYRTIIVLLISVHACSEYVASLFDGGPGRVSKDQSADGSAQDARRSMSVLYADISQREEDPLRPGEMWLLLLSTNAAQESQPADAAAAVLSVRTEPGNSPPDAGSNDRGAATRGEQRSPESGVAGTDGKSRDHDHA